MVNMKQKIDNHNRKKMYLMGERRGSFLEPAIAETNHHVHSKKNAFKRELCTKLLSHKQNR